MLHKAVAAVIRLGPVRVPPALRAEVAAGTAVAAECTTAVAAECITAAVVACTPVAVVECIAVVGVAAATPRPLAAPAGHTAVSLFECRIC
jgi:hypothetical protein